MTFDCVLLARPASWTLVCPRSCIVALRGKTLIDVCQHGLNGGSRQCHSIFVLDDGVRAVLPTGGFRVPLVGQHADRQKLAESRFPPWINSVKNFSVCSRSRTLIIRQPRSTPVLSENSIRPASCQAAVSSAALTIKATTIATAAIHRVLFSCIRCCRQRTLWSYANLLSAAGTSSSRKTISPPLARIKYSTCRLTIPPSLSADSLKSPR
jgi:hypothetical protein